MSSSNKSFGIVFGVFFFILLAFSFYKNQSLNVYYLTLALLFFILGFLNSKILTPLNKAWIKFGELLGMIIAPIVMAIVYFLVIFPTTILLKLFGKDLLGLKINKSSKSFWTLRKSKFNTMNKQF